MELLIKKTCNLNLIHGGDDRGFLKCARVIPFTWNFKEQRIYITELQTFQIFVIKYWGLFRNLLNIYDGAFRKNS